MSIFGSLGAMFGRRAPLYFYNSLRNSIQEFALPAGVRSVRMYNCGPTVYDTSHIGNLRSYVFADVVRRVLEYNGYTVTQVINITDFGHLNSDGDLGNDKMSMALKREGLELSLENMHMLAEKYVAEFMRDLKLLNIDIERITFPRASEHIQGEIALARTLEEKGYAYRGKDGLYFDTSRFPRYGELGAVDLQGLKDGARVAPAQDKRNPSDFLLWKSDPYLGWDSPWGLGFPGWHIECSAMINATLGKQIDIHTGGIDLMPTHHNNEIAQSESATGKRPLSRFWLHHEFLNLDNAKISKSAGNMINLSTLTEKGFSPLAYRYLLLGAHYRTALNFTETSLEAAQNALERLRAYYGSSKEESGIGTARGYEREFQARINNDLDTAGALAILWEMTRDAHVSPAEKFRAAKKFDRVLGLDLTTPSASVVIPEAVQALAKQREEARLRRKWDRADALRAQIEQAGFSIQDTENGPVISPRGRN